VSRLVSTSDEFVGRTTRSAPDHQVRLSAGLVSRYAWGPGDYHDVLRKALETLVERLKAEWGDFEYRLCVDTAPLLERSYARLAGLGWIGRNTCLINAPLGSWFFLGEILVSLELPPDTPPPDRCGTCRRCIDACPTQALVERNGRWQLDAARCISTLTIEQRGKTPEALRQATGQLVFGCDICQEVCPWNRRAPVTDEPAFHPRHAALDLEETAAITAEEFRARFRGTALWRTKYTGLLRNVCTAMGNSKQMRYREQLSRLAESADSGVAAHARWALARLERPE
jgi:epoxyqueuosine reductase